MDRRVVSGADPAPTARWSPLILGHVRRCPSKDPAGQILSSLGKSAFQRETLRPRAVRRFCEQIVVAGGRARGKAFRRKCQPNGGAEMAFANPRRPRTAGCLSPFRPPRSSPARYGVEHAPWTSKWDGRWNGQRVSSVLAGKQACLGDVAFRYGAGRVSGQFVLHRALSRWAARPSFFIRPVFGKARPEGLDCGQTYSFSARGETAASICSMYRRHLRCHRVLAQKLM